MNIKNILSKDICDMEAVRFVARRYGTTPERVLTQYLVQDGLISGEDSSDLHQFKLAPNEVSLLRDLGVTVIK